MSHSYVTKNFDSNLPTLFYGAGEKSAVFVSILLDLFDISPTCFIDKDTLKQGTELLGKPILSLQSAIDLYPDCNIFISTSEEKWELIAEELLASRLIKYEQILNFKIAKKYRSCPWIERSMTMHSKSISFCCVPISGAPRFKTDYSDYSLIPDQLLTLRKQTIDALNTGERTSLGCEKCTYLSDSWYLENEKGKLYDLHISNEGLCQFNCIYCFRKCIDGRKTDIALPDFNAIINEFEKKGLISADNCYIDISCDEITVLPGGNEIISYLSEYPLIVYSNAGVFSNELATALKNPRSRIVTSIDAGTSETFAKIKCRDVFEEVCDNLQRYSQFGNVALKYIFLPGINDNNTDIEGFIELCRRIKPFEVYISSESKSSLNAINLPEETIDIINNLLKKLKELNLNVIMWYFTQDDLSRLNL